MEPQISFIQIIQKCISQNTDVETLCVQKLSCTISLLNITDLRGAPVLVVTGHLCWPPPLPVHSAF